MRRIATTAALAALVVGALTACRPVIVGDSISAMSRGAYGDVMPTAVVDADVGRSITKPGFDTPRGCVQAVQAARVDLTPLEWLVIECGTNDQWDWTDHDEPAWRAGVGALLADVPSTTCVAWVMTANLAFPDRATAFNLIVREQLARRPCSRVVAWDAAVAANPGLLEDPVHPSPAGRRYLALMIAAALSGPWG